MEPNQRPWGKRCPPWEVLGALGILSSIQSSPDFSLHCNVQRCQQRTNFQISLDKKNTGHTCGRSIRIQVFLEIGSPLDYKTEFHGTRLNVEDLGIANGSSLYAPNDGMHAALVQSPENPARNHQRDRAMLAVGGKWKQEMVRVNLHKKTN